MSRPRRDIPEETRLKQQLASDPSASAWVSANAGSGKTFVLTRRVVRLLLGGAAPSQILCLTFTKAAAANMAVRVFDTLAEWVTLDDAALKAAIVETGAPTPGTPALAAARRLFARTVETPGGLKILTIHAFCEKLLHAFPFEANVAAGFSVIEDLRQAELLSRARETVLAEAVAPPDGELAGALRVLASGLSLDMLMALLKELDTHRGTLRTILKRPGGLAAASSALAEALGTGTDTVAALERDMLEDGFPPSEWDAAGRQLCHRAGEAHKAGRALIAAAAATGSSRLASYLAVFFTQDMQPRKPSYLAQKLRAAEPGLCGRLDDEQARLAALVARRSAAAARERTTALLAVADAILGRYETLKRRSGVLDFADLIERTGALLERVDSAWVLHKLDAGIDHILVDEAQDTSPEQWAILQAISQEFFAGEGASRTRRTFFAVGDEKQSIYSFQGARPAMMRTVHDAVKAKALEAGQRFSTVGLLLSFRSVRAVLDVVDRVFSHPGNARGLVAPGETAPPHQALKAKLPGCVEIWTPVKPTAAPEPGDWRLPVDVQEAGSPAVVLAKRVAGEIARLIAPGSGETVDAGEGARRPIGAGDVLILVRARNAFFDAVIRALKEKGVPVAGADRLNLTDHIATMDLVAAGRAALLPDDDYALACLLKSPLIGFDDDDLIRLAPRRSDTLRLALETSTLDRDRAAAARLAVWRDRAATLTPFKFYTRLLGQDGGRRALLSRLGPEASDVIDEFVALTLAHQRDGAPSLLAFLARLETTEHTIKRDFEASSGAVRVMTVHAAKGLEAKVVFLPDTCGAPSSRHDPKLFRLEASDGAPVLAWSPKMGDDIAPLALKRIAERDAALDEHRRLLYVALTRAEERLVIAAFHGKNAAPPDCWYDMIVQADLGPSTPVPAPWDPSETVMRYAEGGAPSPVDLPRPAAPPVPKPLPAWIVRRAPAEPEAPPPIRPSTVLGAADRPERADEAVAAPPRRLAALSGRLVHRLLQHLPTLPADARRAAAERFLARNARGLDEATREGLIDQTLAVIAAPALAPLFGPGSRAEVPLAARLPRPDGAPLAVVGQVDRLGETADAVHLADFKSGRPRPLAETPPSYLAQMALYAAALAPLYPGKPVRAHLVWTAGPTVIEIGGELLAAALDRALQPGDLDRASGTR